MELAGPHQRLVGGQTGLFHRFPKPVQPALGGAVARRSHDEADPAVAEAEQVTGHRLRRPSVVRLDTGAAVRIRGRSDPGIGHSRGVQRLQDPRMIAVGRGEQHPVHVNGAEHPVELDHQVRRRKVHRLHQQMVPGPATGGQGAELGAACVGDARVQQQVADHEGAGAGEAARGDLRTVAEFLGRLQHPLADLLADVRLGVEHPGHGLHRNASALRDLGDGDRRHGREGLPAAAAVLPRMIFTDNAAADVELCPILAQNFSTRAG